MKCTYVVLTFILIASQQHSYGMENEINSQPARVISDHQFPPFQQAVWAQIKKTIEVKEKTKLPHLDLNSTTVNQPIIIGNQVRLALYLLVSYALNTSHYNRVEHYLDFIRYSIENGADINGFAGYETTLIYLARFASQQQPSSLDYKSDNRVMEVLEFLLKTKPNLNLQHGQHQGTALFMAIGNAFNETTFDVVDALLEAGANPNIPNIDGQTPIMQAARTGHFKLIRLFVDRKARIDLKYLDKDAIDITESTKEYLKVCVDLQEVNRTLAKIALNVETLAKKREQEQRNKAQESEMNSALSRSIKDNETERKLQRPPSND